MAILVIENYPLSYGEMPYGEGTYGYDMPYPGGGPDSVVKSATYTDSVPPKNNDTQGELPSLTVTREYQSDDLLKRTHPATLYAGDYSVRGTISDVSIQDWATTFTIDTDMGWLNSYITIPAQTGTVVEWLEALFVQLGHAGALDTSKLPATEPYNTSRAWPRLDQDTAWTRVKQLCNVYSIHPHFNTETGIIEFLPANSGELELGTISSHSISSSTQQVSTDIEVSYHEIEDRTGMIWPKDGWTGDTSIQTAQAGVLEKIQIQIDGWVDWVDQPEMITSIGPYDTITKSVFTLIGSDKLPIQPDEFDALGGEYWFEIDKEDNSIVNFYIFCPTGMYDGDGSKIDSFSVALSSGDADYSTMRIYGRAWIKTDKTLTSKTGAVAVEKTTATVSDNPFVGSLEQAYDYVARMANTYAGLELSGSVTSSYTSKAGDMLNRYAGKRFWDELRGGYLMAHSVDQDISSLSLSVIDDTQVGDIDSAYSGMTVGEVDALYSGYTYGDAYMKGILREG
jgi:hypothetical protein